MSLNGILVSLTIIMDNKITITDETENVKILILMFKANFHRDVALVSWIVNFIVATRTG